MNKTTIPASTPPAPAAGSASGTEAKVCRDVARRQDRGLRKYGVSVERNPADLRQWLQHAYEECLDQAIYLRRAMDEMDEPRNPNQIGGGQ